MLSTKKLEAFYIISALKQPAIYKQRSFFTTIFKFLFFFIQMDPSRGANLSKLVFTNSWVLKPKPPTGTKRLKNPIQALAQIRPSLNVLSFKQSLSTFKHVLRTLMALTSLIKDFRHNKKSTISFLFFFLASPNLIQIYKFSIYKTSLKLEKKPS